MDGVVISFAIVSGIIGANFSINIILIPGAADIVADVFFQSLLAITLAQKPKMFRLEELGFTKENSKRRSPGEKGK